LNKLQPAQLRQGHARLGSFARLFGEAKNRSEAEPAVARPPARRNFCAGGGAQIKEIKKINYF